MNETFTVDSMIKEIKKNLDKYEKMLKTYETYQSQKSYIEITTLQKTIDKNIVMVQPIANKDEHKYMLTSYKELLLELNKQLNQTQSKLKQKANKDGVNSLFNENNNNNCKNGIGNISNINSLSEERELLKGALRSSNEIVEGLKLTDSTLTDQKIALSKSSEQNIKILKKIPLIESILGKIQFHYIKEKIIIGIVIGLIVVLGLYLTIYK